MNEQTFAKLIALSETMLEHAKNNQWEEIESIDQSRQRCMHAAFNNINQNDLTSVQSSIKEILKIDAQIVALAEQEKTDIQQTLTKAEQVKQLYTSK